MNERSRTTLGGRFTFPGTSLTVQRIGYGAMQLAGPGVWGRPKDPDGAVAVLREAVAAGVNHIDTSDYYGPHVTNQIIRQALHPYPAGLVIVTKLGGRRLPDKSWQPAISPEELIAGEVTRYWDWVAGLAAVPVLTEMRASIERLIVVVSLMSQMAMNAVAMRAMSVPMTGERSMRSSIGQAIPRTKATTARCPTRLWPAGIIAPASASPCIRNISTSWSRAFIVSPVKEFP